MKGSSTICKALIALTALLALLAGCGTSMSSRFYRMYPAQTADAKPAQASPAAITVSIGPVEVPAYLQRPQIATRLTGSELAYAEYDRWAGPLKDNISDVLVEDISANLSGDGFAVRLWDMRVTSDYQVEVRVREFEGYPGRSVRLNAAWSVMNTADRKVLASRRSVIDKDTRGAGYQAYVDAMDGALADLAREISDSVRTLKAGR